MRMFLSEILKEVAEDDGLTVDDLTGECRERRIAWPRQRAYYRAFVECPHLSYPEIARRIGGRDHTTILHGVRRYCERVGVDYADVVTERNTRKVYPGFASSYALYGYPLMEAAHVQH